jgi:hypothetical protein
MRILGLVALLVVALLMYVAYSCWPPRDLALASIRIVPGDYRQFPHDVGSGSTRDLYAIIEFKTSKNLARFAQNGLYEEIFADQYFCGAPDKERGRLGGGEPLVYDRYGPIGLGENPAQKIGNPAYRIYMNLRQGNVIGSMPYDLVKHPQDVCFVVTPQLSFVGLWPPSNEVRIPKEQLVKAIDQYKHEHPGGI